MPMTTTDSNQSTNLNRPNSLLELYKNRKLILQKFETDTTNT